MMPQLPIASAATHALAWLLYPIIFFFGFLYYTDAGSLLLVLGMYDLAQRHRVRGWSHSGATWLIRVYMSFCVNHASLFVCGSIWPRRWWGRAR